MLNFDRLTKLELLSSISNSLEVINSKLDSSQLNGKFLCKQFLNLYKKFFTDFVYQEPKPQISNETEVAIEKLCDTLCKGITDNPIQNFANFYFNMVKLPDITKAASLVTRLFLYNIATALSISLDFRRIPEELIPKFKQATSIEDITKCFEHALNKEKRFTPPTVKTKWQEWPNARFKYKDRCLLGSKQGDSTLYYAIDGKLVTEHEFIEHEGELYYKAKQDIAAIDGIVIENKLVPLIDLKKDILTGLDTDSELPRFIKIIHEKNVGISEVVAKLIELEESLNPEDFKLVQKTAKRLLTTIPHVQKLAKEAFNKSKPVGEYYFFITIGGSGSGKSVLEKYAMAKCEDNLMVASLDQSRYESSIYQILVEANHHDDDYEIIKQFANTLRDTVVGFALEGDYNLFFDGSGVPYKGKYGHLIEIFDNSKYKTVALGADTPFLNDKGGSSAHDRIISRFNGPKDHRTLPWSVAIAKHQAAPRAFLDAIEDIKLDSFVLFDSAPPIESTYALAFTKFITLEQLQELQKLKNSEDIIKYLTNSKILTDEHKLPETVRKNLKFRFDIVNKELDNNNKVKVLIITNEERFLEILEKTLIHTKAEGPDSLNFNERPYFIPQLDRSF